MAYFLYNIQMRFITLLGGLCQTANAVNVECDTGATVT